jgi:hypothetical protein
MLKSGIGPDDKPLAEARRARYAAILEDADAAFDECLQFHFRGTDVAFEDRLTLRLGNRDVQVMYLGRANTAGDAVVYVPDAKVRAAYRPGMTLEELRKHVDLERFRARIAGDDPVIKANFDACEYGGGGNC